MELGPDAKARLSQLRLSLGETRYRVALLRFGRRQTQCQIARRLGMSQPAVSKHLAIIDREFRPAQGGGRHHTRSLTDDDSWAAACSCN